MNNANFHKSAKVKELIEIVDCRFIYLPSYSLDLNPIEHILSNLKKSDFILSMAKSIQCLFYNN